MYKAQNHKNLSIVADTHQSANSIKSMIDRWKTAKRNSYMNSNSSCVRMYSNTILLLSVVN